jgi:hypothetical protein
VNQVAQLPGDVVATLAGAKQKFSVTQIADVLRQHHLTDLFGAEDGLPGIHDNSLSVRRVNH